MSKIITETNIIVDGKIVNSNRTATETQQPVVTPQQPMRRIRVRPISGRVKVDLTGQPYFLPWNHDVPSHWCECLAETTHGRAWEHNHCVVLHFRIPKDKFDLYTPHELMREIQEMVE